MRKLEYCTNCKRGFLGKLYWRWRFHSLDIRLGFDNPINTCGPGLCIRHWGNVVVNPNAILGVNCIVQQGVVIGRGNRSDDIPTIGANVVVDKSFLESGVVIAGIPARIVGKKDKRLR